jgi:hypothetical protein
MTIFSVTGFTHASGNNSPLVNAPLLSTIRLSARRLSLNVSLSKGCEDRLPFPFRMDADSQSAVIGQPSILNYKIQSEGIMAYWQYLFKH